MQINRANFSECLGRFCSTSSVVNKFSGFMAELKKLENKEKNLKAELEHIQDAKVDLMINHTGANAFNQANEGRK